MSSLAEKIMKAKTRLILKQPFFASLLMGMPLTQDDSIPTIATDGKGIRYNGKFLDSLTEGEMLFAFAHEVMHCVFQHMTRRGHRTPRRYNIAGDYVINGILRDERIGSMPKGALHDSALVTRGGGTTEGVYDLLPDEEQSAGAGQPGGALDDCQDAAQDAAENSQAEAEMRIRVIQAANAARMAGQLSSGVERLVREITAPRTDWRTALRNFMAARARTDLSYAKPKRRFMADDISLPSLTGEKLGSIAIAVDCSGSVTEKILRTFEAEVRAICEDTQPSAVKIIYFDSSVLRTEVIEDMTGLKLKAVGGGGTDFAPIFPELSQDDIAACVILTDLECSSFGECPDFPVLWAVTSDLTEVPFGTVLSMKGG